MAYDWLAFVEREIQNHGAPSKKHNKVRKGSMRKYNAQRTGQNVGGTKNTIRAMYAPADQHLCVIKEHITSTSNMPQRYTGKPYEAPRYRA